MIKYIDQNNTYIDAEVTIGDNTIIYPNVIIEGNSQIGKNCIIHFGTYIKDSIIVDNTTIYNSFIISSQIGSNSQIGPFAHIRANNIIENNVHIGSFVEIKNSNINENSKISHLAYVGDSSIGKKVNIGGGVITANYDGKNKYKTDIKDEAFIGSNATLIAPVEVGNKSYVAAGSTIDKNVPDNNLAIARKHQENKNRKNR